ncbi:MAG: hypothetical protein AAGA68_26720 [Pseudomonadota bacterium]
MKKTDTGEVVVVDQADYFEFHAKGFRNCSDDDLREFQAAEEGRRKRSGKTAKAAETKAQAGE